jgi:FMN reductase
MAEAEVMIEDERSGPSNVQTEQGIEQTGQRPLRFVAVSAGVSVPSSTRLLADRLAQTAQRVANESGRDTEIRVIELRDLAADIANNIVAGFPSPRLAEAQSAVAGADGLIAVTPIFSGSYSGLFKSFFDVMDPDALTGKSVLIAATGGTPRHSLALEHALRPLFSYLRAIVIPTAVYAASQDWGADGDTQHGELAERISRAGRELAEFVLCRAANARRTHQSEAADGSEYGGEAVAESASPGDDFIPFAERLAALGL